MKKESIWEYTIHNMIAHPLMEAPPFGRFHKSWVTAYMMRLYRKHTTNSKSKIKMWHLEKIKKMNEEPEAPPQQETSDEVLKELLEVRRKLAELAEKLEKIVRRHLINSRSITSYQKRTIMGRHSGAGIKSVKKLFSGLTNRQASLHLLPPRWEIYSSYGLKITKRSKRIGEVEVSRHPAYSSP